MSLSIMSGIAGSCVKEVNLKPAYKIQRDCPKNGWDSPSDLIISVGKFIRSEMVT
jgi:hypothetical protein